MRYVNRLLGWFRSSAKTVGLSPKILAPAIGAGITAGLAAVGVTPHDIGQALGLSDELAAGAIASLASTVALWLLPPGAVIPPGEPGVSNDELLVAGLKHPGDQLPKK